MLEKKLIEFTIEWESLPIADIELAEAVRLFVLTWDPLETSPPRPPAFVSVRTDPLELAVYLPCWSLAGLAAAHDTTAAAVLIAAASSVLETAASQREVVLSGEYPDLAVRGRVPDLAGDLVSRLAGATGLAASLTRVSSQWEAVGLSAIQDIVQHAFGTVDLDRSPVELSARRPEPDCPACAGRRFDFPADLAESRDGMCLVHRGEAEGVIRRRLARAEVSNPAGWRAIEDASRRQGLQHVPNGLAAGLAGVEQAMYETSDTTALGEYARLVVEAAGWFEGLPDELGEALGEDPDFLLGLPDWLVTMPLVLGRAGLGDEAVMVGEALGRVDPDQQHVFEAHIAIALAEARQADRARERVAANLARWPDEFWVLVNAGDALAALGDIAGAEAHFRAALDLADAGDDVADRGHALARIADLHGEGGAKGVGRLARTGPQPPAPAAPVIRHQRRKPPSRSKRKR